MLVQLPYFNKDTFKTAREFYVRLKPFLLALPKDYRWALEIRNKWWIKNEFLELLRQHNIALAMIDQSWTPPIDQILREYDLDTTDFAYIRWLGDRKGIEEITKSWDRVVVDRGADLARWVVRVRKLLSRGRQIYGFFNNHYAGHAPASLSLFLELLNSDRQFEMAF